MDKISAWLFLLAGVVWLLPLINVDTVMWGQWVIAIAFIVIGILEVKRTMGK